MLRLDTQGSNYRSSTSTACRRNRPKAIGWREKTAVLPRVIHLPDVISGRRCNRRLDPIERRRTPSGPCRHRMSSSWWQCRGGATDRAFAGDRLDQKQAVDRLSA
jgi:hypothetical protein